MKKGWTVLFILSFLYLIGTVGSTELAETLGQEISFWGDCIRIGVGIFALWIFGSLAGAWD